VLARPAPGTQLSRSEDRAISIDIQLVSKSLFDSGLQYSRNPAIVALALPLEGMLHDSGSTMKRFAVLLAGLALSAATLHAQSSSSGVPESHRPPPGMCRIWIDGVPPAHQPAPTDCATAIRKRPLNARVVFGSDAPGTERSFAPPSPTPSREAQERAAQQQRDAQQQQQQQRDAQERQRAEAQRQREEQEKRAAANRAPPPPPRTQDRAAPAPRPHTEKPQRPPHSFSTRRPG
jgi:hypothetical protein